MRFDRCDEDAKPEEKKVLLHLFFFSDGSAKVSAVDKNGYEEPGGSLIDFNTDGTICLRAGVSSEFGFQLDDSKQIKIK